MKSKGVLDLTQDLVRIESTNPGAGETAMEKYILTYLSQLDSTNLHVQTEEVMEGRSNIMATIEGQNDAPELVWICHMDTVPVGDNWDEDPFGGVHKDNKIYGRGSCDMKSGLACALRVFGQIAKGKRPNRTLKLIATVDEEGNMAGVKKAIDSKWVSQSSYVLDMEPTNGQIQMAHKGRIWFKIHIKGITAHASTPHKGADAIGAMADVISYLKKEIVTWKAHEELGRTTITFGKIRGGQEPYIVSDDCTLFIDVRYVPPYKGQDVEATVKKAILYAEESTIGVKGSYEITGDCVGVERNDSSPLMNRLKESCKKVIGSDVTVGVFPGYTDSAVIAGQLDNRNCMSYGPGNLEVAHKPDEYVCVEDVIRCKNVLSQLAFDMCFDGK